MNRTQIPDPQSQRLYLILAVLGVILACVGWFEFMR
jgi:hypothetical protein